MRRILKHKGSKAQRHEGFETKKIIINVRRFQPFELIEHIEPLERFFTQRRKGTNNFFNIKLLVNGKRFQP